MICKSNDLHNDAIVTSIKGEYFDCNLSECNCLQLIELINSDDYILFFGYKVFKCLLLLHLLATRGQSRSLKAY